MTKILTPTEIRKQLLSRGYEPLPNRDKRCLLKKWSTVAIDDKVITTTWSRMHNDKATGLRLGNRLAGADCDITLFDVLEEVKRLWADAYPDVFDNVGVPLLERGTTASCKVAYFFRIEEPFGRIATRDFRDADGGIHKVEIFGGKSKRQFGAFGAHSLEKGTEYVWPVDSPLDVGIVNLPVLAEADCEAMVAIADDVMVQAGLTPVVRVYDDTDADVVYDLTDKMEFESGDSVYTLDELKEALKHTDHLRLTAGWHDPSGINATRCIARLLEDGALMITDFGEDGRKHMEAGRDATITQEAVDAAFEVIGSLEEALAQPQEGDGLAKTTALLLKQYCLCPALKTPVVEIYDPDHQMGQANFMSSNRRFGVEVVGPQGGRKMINPAAMWLDSKKLTVVRGLVMRPDMPTPFYEEDGHQWLNRYQPPEHDQRDATLALVGLFVRFMEHLLPYADERKWFIDRLAHKYQHPEIPGPGVIMVAAKPGTGRQTLFSIMKQLFGRKYVKTIDPSQLTGEIGQAQYTDWQVNSLAVCVDELVSPGHSFMWQRKRIAERWKILVDPGARSVAVIQKYSPNFEGISYASMFAATNRHNAIPMEADDRRTEVVRGGETLESNAALSAAMREVRDGSAFTDAFIAAVAGFLGSRDVSKFDPYAVPPMFEGKRIMIDAAVTDTTETALQVRRLLWSRKPAMPSTAHGATWAPRSTAKAAARRTSGCAITGPQRSGWKRLCRVEKSCSKRTPTSD
jgi:hypothetical protein